RGGFTIPTAFATDGSADGEHTLALQARDAAGNASSLITRSFKLDTRAPALSLESPTADVPLTGASRLQGVADANGSVLVALSYALDGGTPTPLIFEAASGAFDQPLAIRDLAVGSHTLTLRALDAAGNESTLARSVTVEELAAFTVTETSPIAGAEDVGATYRPQVFFSRAVDAATLTAETFYATDTTGAKLAANIVVGDGGNFAWLFFTNPMPGASVVTVHLAASEIRAAAGGQALDADGDGTPEADFTFRFSTVNLASVPGTILRGKVVDPGPDLEPMSFDDLRRGPDGVPYTADDIDLHPLANVEVFILGRPDLHTFTDGEGFFELTDTPVGDVKVVVNGRTASNAPDGFYFPEMTMDVTLEAGRVNTMMGSMGSREAMAAHEERLQVYLPRLQQAILRSVDNTLRQTITLDPESAPNLTPDQIGRLRLEFQPGSLIGEDGQQLANAQIGISVVPPELVRDMMPPGTTRHGFDITIQAPGVAAFATPLPISFPNDLGLAPGTKANLLSFDHTTGRLEVRGSMTVSEDGTMVVSDPGTGITQPGWHWWLSNSNGSGGPPPPCPPVASSGSPTIRTPSAFFLTGDTGGGITIPDFTLTAPAGSTGSGSPPPPPPRNSYTLSFDGPLMDFVSVTIDGAPYNELSPYQVTLCPGDAPKIVHFTPKLYKDMSAAWGRNFAELTRDQLYGAAVTLRADKDPGTGGPVTSTEETRYIYRWVDVVDANAALAKTGNTAAFLRTNADGVVREKNVDVHLGSFQTTFSPPLLGSWFDFGSAVDSSTRMAKWKFDPPRRGSYSDPFDIWANDPHSGLINVGSITAIGSATDSTTISFNIDDFADELRRVILSLREVIDPGYQPGNPGDDDRDGEVDEPDEYGFPGSNDTREIVYLRQGLNHIYTDDFEPMRVAGGSKQWVLVAQNPGIPTEKEHYFVPSRQFTNLFRDFMPSKRADSGADGILGTTDDEFSSAQLNALDVLINQQALDLMANVGTDFGFLGSAATFAADPLFKDVSSEWKDIPFQFAPSPGFQPIGKATLFDFDRVKMLNLMGTPGRTDPMTRTTFGSDIPQAAQQWALAEYINLQEDDKVTVMIGACLTYYRPVDPLSFGGYLANVFSHEVGHTFGLNEGYLNWGDSPRYGGTANINGNGDATPWNDLMNSGGGNTDLGFQPETRALLEAAAGLPVASATNPDLPLTASLKMWLDNFNLSSNENGRSMALEDVPPVPEIVVNSGGAQYYGWGDESSDFSEVPFGGNTGTAVENTLTIRNIGTAPLHVDSIRLEHGDRGFSIVSAPAGSQTIDAGGTQLVTVQFQPQRTGQSIDRLLIASDSGSVTAFSLNLVGVGIPAAPTADVSIRNSNPGGAAPGSSVTLHGAAIVSNAGHEPLTIAVPNSANVGSAEFVVTGIGPGGGVGPVVLAHGESAEVSFRFSPERAGLRTGTVGLSTNDPDRPTIEIQLAGTGLGSVQSPQWGNDYVAIEFPSQPNTATLRTRSDTSGNFQLWIPPNQAYHEVVFDPETGLVAHGYGRTNDAGVITDLSGTLVFTASTAPDSDFDGLPDDIEFVIGTSSSSPDSDRDGLRDFAEWDMDSDPLDGRSLPAGLLAVTGLQGEAKGVVLAGHTDGARGQIAYVATGTYGLAIVDAPNMLKPVVAGQIELPGDAVDVSLDTRLGLAAVATGGSLEVVDVSNANAPRVARSIPVAAGQVEVVEGVAYVAVGGAIESYSLLTGDRLESVPSGAGDIVGLAADRGVLFAADVGKRLVAVDLSGATMLPVGTIDLPASSGQVFVGGGIAYVGGGASGGFVTVDVSDPSAMLLLSGVDSTAIAGNAIVATGSGDALTLGTSAGAPVLTLADVRDPARTDQLVNSFRLPATAHSLAVGSGLAFVAGGASGLIVVNYRSFDTEGKPPIVSVSAPGADIDPATDGIQVLEGTTLALDIAAQDDRQIARVELLVDGQVAISDVSYPWPGSVVLPTIKDSDDTVSISLRAVDTGGNVGLSDLLEVQLVRDAVAPTLVGSNAPDGAVRGTAFRVLTLEFSEALAAATVTPATVVLSDTAGTVIAAQDIQLRRDGVELQLTYPPLAEGSYQLRLVASEITDRAGNPLGTTDITSAFTIGETHTVEWIGSSSGFWDDPENWSSGVLPGPGDEVVIDVAPGGRIDHRAGATTIRSLTSNGNLQLSGGTLELTGDSSIRGVFTLTGGTLTGAGTLTLAGGGNRWEGGAMTGSGTTRIAAGADLLVTGRLGVLTLAGRTIHNDGTIVVDRGAAGEVVIQPSGAALIRNLGTFEIATQARIGNATHPVAGPRFENPGLLRVRADTVLAVDLDNAGTVDVSAGTRLSLAGAGTGNSSGDFQVAEGATLALPGRQRFESTASASGGGRLDLGSSGRLEIAGGSYDLTVALADGAELSIEAPTTLRFLEMTGGALSGTGPLTLTLPQSELLGGTITVPLIEPPDTVRPMIIESSVSDGATYTLVLGRITLQFSEAMRPESLVPGHFFLLDDAGERIDVLSVAIGTRFRSVTLEVPRLTNGRYRLVVAGDQLEDHRAGNHLADGDWTIAAFRVVLRLFDGALYPTGDGTHSAVLGDVDGDGDLDIVTANTSSASVLLGNGDGTFADRVDYDLPPGSANSVTLGDVDGDGDLDIVTSSSYFYSSSSASVLLGKGDGSFAARVDYALPIGANSVALGDVDGDGDLDIVTSS
ncbi:MAG: Ig-like domain-containing protein, partial [Candidatus Accumulibacter sp.]|uniref:Ig-like domain-containing protein n=1 Tax=Accumulibacter sp. TaxID=2053492 RepID=UPI0025829BB4